jgi:glycosyltransferase involved in cell wall biosynthesis
MVRGVRALFQRTPILAEGFYFKELESMADEIIRRKAIDAVILEGAWLGRYWPRLQRKPLVRVLDAHNIEEELLRRSAGMKNSLLKRVLLYHDALKMRWMERRILTSADLIFVTSERERQLLSDRHRRASVVFVAPNGVDCRRTNPLPLRDTHDILFLGALDYLPNAEGIIFFAEHVFPQIRAGDPEVRLHIVGRSPGESLRRLDRLEGIRVHGEVADVAPFYAESAVVIVPLRVGGGTRLKIVEAMAYGRPVVSTSAGCEGLEVEDGKHLLIADNARQMREAVLMLLRQPGIGESLAVRARRLVEAKYDWRDIAGRMLDTIAARVQRQQRADESSCRFRGVRGCKLHSDMF